MPKKLLYEQPLQERIRTFIRAENLLARSEFFASRSQVWDSQAAIQSIIDLSALFSRGDVKSEVLKEIERQHLTLNELSTKPGVDKNQLELILAQQQVLTKELHALKGKIGSHLESNEFLSSIRQRATMPGGPCDFDLPAYYHWLKNPNKVRQEDLINWLRPFTTIRTAIDLILKIIRKGTNTQAEVAEKGFYQQNLDSAISYQLIRVLLPADSIYFPEISAGKQRFSIRFFQQGSPLQHQQQCKENITFEIACCMI
ncbi:MAG: cell division protein ZapD [Gammaproteobacteria bacterium]|nr:cell division protein ZapD [Gammaproteobacteria bacterium]